MTHNHVEAGRAEDLHRGAGRAADGFGLGQSAAAEETGEVDVDIMRADAVASNDELTGTGLLRPDRSDIDAIGRAGGIDLGNVGARARPDGRQAGRQHYVRHHVGQIETGRSVLDRNRDLEELLQRLDPAVDDDDAGNRLSAWRLDDDNIRAAGDTTGYGPRWGGAAATAADGPAAGTAAVSGTRTGRYGHRLAYRDRELTDGQHDGEHRDVEVARIVEIDDAAVDQQLRFLDGQRTRACLGDNDRRRIDVSDQDRIGRGGRLRCRREVVDRGRDQRIFAIRSQRNVEAESRRRRIQFGRNGTRPAFDPDRRVGTRGATYLYDLLHARRRHRIEHGRRQRAGIFDCRRADKGVEGAKHHAELQNAVIERTGIDSRKGNIGTANRRKQRAAGAGATLIRQDDVKQKGRRMRRELDAAGDVRTVSIVDHAVDTGAENRNIDQGHRRRYLRAQRDDLRRFVRIVTVNSELTARAAAATATRCSENDGNILCLARIENERDALSRQCADDKIGVIADHIADVQRCVSGITDSQ